MLASVVVVCNTRICYVTQVVRHFPDPVVFVHHFQVLHFQHPASPHLCGTLLGYTCTPNEWRSFVIAGRVPVYTFSTLDLSAETILLNRICCFSCRQQLCRIRNHVQEEPERDNFISFIHEILENTLEIRMLWESVYWYPMAWLSVITFDIRSTGAIFLSAQIACSVITVYYSKPFCPMHCFHRMSEC